MVERWKDFDWRAVEARINAHPNYLTEIDGQTIHVVHVKSAVPGARALLLAHTYPGSFLEFLPLVDPLTDAGFDVVIPSMPGFGFSTPVVDGGWTMARVARAYDELMRRLGYASYGVHGSDGGALVGRELAILDPEGFLGAHVLQLFSFPSGDPAEFEGFGPKEYAALEHMQWFQSVGGYNAMNGSRPPDRRGRTVRQPGRQLAYSELFESFGNGPRWSRRAGARSR
jgi:pimeloyl-ACP methyl ester carboxylesterase